MSAPDLSAILGQLQALEPLIYAANDGQQPRAHFEALLAPGFWEIGASGCIYTRDVVLDTLEARQLAPRTEAWSASEHRVQLLAPDLYLLTYTLTQPTRVSRRATVWRATPAGWQMVYHQGTVLLPGR
jgi:hypothetical protein